MVFELAVSIAAFFLLRYYTDLMSDSNDITCAKLNFNEANSHTHKKNYNFTSIIYLWDFGRDIEPVLNVIYIFKVDFSIFEKSGSETYVKISDDFIFNILCQTDFMLYFSLPLPESCSFSCHG